MVAVDARRSARRTYFSAGTDWRWVDGDSQEDGYNAAPGPVTPPVQSAVLALQRVSGGTQRSVGRLRAGHLHADAEADAHAQRARRSAGGTTTAHNLEINVAAGHADRQQPRCCPRRERHRRQPARRGALSRHRPRQRLGRRQLRLPRADAQRAVPPVPRRRGAHARQRSARPRAAGRRRSRRQRRAARATVTWRTTWFDNRVKNPVVERHASRDAGANARSSGRTSGGRASGAFRPTSSTASARRGASAAAICTTRPRSTEVAANPALVGKFLPQVPEHRGSVQVAYAESAGT